MRAYRILSFTLVAMVLGASTPKGEQLSGSLSAVGAKQHVGEVATVCGQVVEFGCDRPYTSLTFAPLVESEPFKVRLADANGEQSGRRPEEQYLGRIICVRGQIEELGSRYQISVPGKDALRIVTEPKPPVAAFAPDAYRACEADVVLPKVKLDAKPGYTSGAMQRKVQGAVWMRGVVNIDGTAGEVQVRRSLDSELDMETLRAFRQWNFVPGTYLGKPAPVIVTTVMTFTLRR